MICLALPECLSDSEANRDGADAEFPFPLSFPFSASFKNSSPLEKAGKSCFFEISGPSLCISISVAKYNIFPRADNGCTCEKNFWQSDLLTPSVSTVEIWSTLTYTEFDCVALLAML